MPEWIVLDIRPAPEAPPVEQRFPNYSNPWRAARLRYRHLITVRRRA